MHTVNSGRWYLNYNSDLSGEAHLRFLDEGHLVEREVKFPAELLRMIVNGAIVSEIETFLDDKLKEAEDDGI